MTTRNIKIPRDWPGQFKHLVQQIGIAYASRMAGPWPDEDAVEREAFAALYTTLERDPYYLKMTAPESFWEKLDSGALEDEVLSVFKAMAGGLMLPVRKAGLRRAKGPK